MLQDTRFLAQNAVLVTGGTGSFGKAILDQLLKTEIRCVRIFSRDEAKQDSMREMYRDARIEFITGDVRDIGSLTDAMRGCSYVFHAAALKQVPNCERFPLEAIRTNVLGAVNVITAAKQCRPLCVVAISTDKAVEPLNTMGLTKALMERIVLDERNDCSRMICVRYGNVVGSRGSVVPLFLGRIEKKQPLPVTHPNMTRFLLCLEDAVDLVIHAARDGQNGELWVRKMPAATVQTIAEACLKARAATLPIQVIGVRPGEKMDEVLVSFDEMRRAVERSEHFVVKRDKSGGSRQEEYTSANTQQLTVNEVVPLLQRAGLV